MYLVNFKCRLRPALDSHPLFRSRCSKLRDSKRSHDPGTLCKSSEESDLFSRVVLNSPMLSILDPAPCLTSASFSQLHISVQFASIESRECILCCKHHLPAHHRPRPDSEPSLLGCGVERLTGRATQLRLRSRHL